MTHLSQAEAVLVAVLAIVGCCALIRLAEITTRHQAARRTKHLEQRTGPLGSSYFEAGRWHVFAQPGRTISIRDAGRDGNHATAWAASTGITSQAARDLSIALRLAADLADQPESKETA